MERYMGRAIELAKKGEGYVNPNPMVGAVIVKDYGIIGEGYHERFGLAHAEINAMANAKGDIAGSTMYVTLEPCSHYGKTPPCAKAIIDRGIGKVVVGMLDPNPLVSGKGIGMLRDAGIEVEVCNQSEEIEALYLYFKKYILTRTPFCVMKTAMTLDGKIATVSGESQWITGEEARAYGHGLRHGVAAIMVGIGTVLEDNPTLTTRLQGKKGSDAIRVIVDSKGRIPLDAKVLHTASEVETIIATTERIPEEKKDALERMGATVLIGKAKEGRVDLIELFQALGNQGIDSVLLEGGSELSYGALEAGVVDQVVAFVAPKLFGGACAKTPVGGQGIASIADAIQLSSLTSEKVGEDIMIKGMVERKSSCLQG